VANEGTYLSLDLVNTGNAAFLPEVTLVLLDEEGAYIDLVWAFFCLEVAQGLPVALTVASHSKALAQCTVDVLHGQSARIYSSTDIMGVEIGGALKNIIAIACGASDGLHLGRTPEPH